MSNPLQKLVDSYCVNPSPGLRHRIINGYTPLVRHIVGKIKSPKQPLTLHEDLESEGISGLIQALDTYDNTKNAQFITFAYYRIYGSVIDYLREIDRVSKYNRAKLKKVHKAIHRRSQELGRDVCGVDIIHELDMPLGKCRELIVSEQSNEFSLDDILSDGDSSYYEIIANPNVESPDTDIQRKEVTEKIKEKIQQIDERDRLILTLYYYDDMTMREIAMLVELSQAMVSKIISKLLLQLKDDLTSDGFEQAYRQNLSTNIVKSI